MRSKTKFPLEVELNLCSFLKLSWENGWLDEYSDNHFLIKAIENRLVHFVAIEQLINNNINFVNMVNPDGSINSNHFNLNFCINFSRRLEGLYNSFGKDAIKRFITDQLSAGKQNYSEDAFFQALSEISILSFFTSLRAWTKIAYEPPVINGVNNKNPEASFSGTFLCKDPTNPPKNIKKSIVLNVEVKSPQFPHDSHTNEKIAIPTVLLTSEGKQKVKDFCAENNIRYLDPRILKIRDFINSAASKFNTPQKDEYNILYINWSFRDFPSNAFLEAWALLTNEKNGILIHQKYAKKIGIDPDALNKISAIVVYTESLEGIAFSDFRYVWQQNGAGQRFRMWVTNNELRQLEREGNSDILFKITGMRPSDPLTQYVMLDGKSKNNNERVEASCLGYELHNVIKENID